MIHTSYTVGITTGEYKALQYVMVDQNFWVNNACLLYTSPSPRDRTRSRMPSSA